MPASAVQPRDSHAIAFLQMSHARAQFSHKSRAFVSRDKRQSGFDRPIAISRMQVGVADAACDHLNQRLSRPWIWNWNFLNL